MWHKAASTPRPRLSTIHPAPLINNNSLRHTQSAASFSDLITCIPVFDIDTVVQYLGKLDEIKYKKEKISLDSIRGGITGEYAKEKELMRQLFCDQLAYILDVLENQKNKASSATWSYLFSQRSQKCQDIIPSNKIAHYHNLLKNYLRILKKREARDGMSPITTARIKLGDTFMEFLKTHTTDPDSCLVGLPCSDESLKSVVRHVDPAATDTSNASTITHHQLCSMIVEWGVGEDDAWMKDQIQKLCTNFRGVDRMEQGDLGIIAVTNEEKKSMVFGRFTGMKKQNNTHLEFFLNAEESKKEWIARREVYPMPANMKEAIKNKAHLSKVVQDPASNFFKILKDNMKMQVDEFLIKNGVDTTTFKKVRESSVELKDIPSVRKALNMMLQFQETPPEHFYKEMTFYAKALVSIHTRKMASIPTFTFFMTREGTVSSIRNFANSPLAPSLMRTTLGLFQSAYNGLAVSVKELMFGSKKRKMSDWWLERIEHSVQHFLVKRKFDFDAIPENYSIEPPQDIKAVKENLAILEEILHSEIGDSMSPVPLVEAVTTEIYPVIDAFIKDSRIVICDALNLEINFEDSTFKMETIEESFKNTKDSLPTQIAEQLKNLIGDLKYLDEMKRLEKAKDGEKMSHIVPIGGLVMNQLVRQWNEHKTVVELWGHLDKPPEPPAAPPSTPTLLPLSLPLSPPSPLSSSPSNMKASRSMDSLALDSSGSLIDPSKPNGPDIVSHDKTTGSSLAAAIAASFFIKTSTLPSPRVPASPSPPPPHLHTSPSHSYLSLPHPSVSTSSSSFLMIGGELNKKKKNVDHGRSNSDGTEELVNTLPSKPSAARRNNSSIGIVTTLRVSKKEKEREKERVRELEREREREREKLEREREERDKEMKNVMQLHKLVAEQRVDEVKQILQDPNIVGVINAQDADGWTPLHCCSHIGNFELAQLFLAIDQVDVSLKNKDGNTALHYIVRHAGSTPIIKSLLLKGADPNVINSRSETPLHYACMRGHLDIISHLLENGANANALNSDGDNALHYAIFTRSLNTTKLLLKSGVNPDVCSKRQGTPLDIAIKQNLFEIAVELKKAVKNTSEKKLGSNSRGEA